MLNKKDFSYIFKNIIFLWLLICPHWTLIKRLWSLCPCCPRRFASRASRSRPWSVCWSCPRSSLSSPPTSWTRESTSVCTVSWVIRWQRRVPSEVSTFWARWIGSRSLWCEGTSIMIWLRNNLGLQLTFVPKTYLGLGFGFGYKNIWVLGLGFWFR